LTRTDQGLTEAKAVVKQKTERRRTALQIAAVGLESEFSVFVDDKQVRPEDLFGDPRAFLRGSLRHRVGTSYQLPTGAAVYFDTGVIEVATPVIELERGAVARAGRSLWESIGLVRDGLNTWERRRGRSVRLVGFSTHYNVSMESSRRPGPASLDRLARLLTYLLPAPVMLLALNRRSTGVGVRPRGDRIEVTADFTPSSTLMVAAGSLITGIVREVATWPSFDLRRLEAEGLPRIRGFKPIPHTSRKGWLARVDCYPENPVTAEDHSGLRDTATRIFSVFQRSIARVADPLTLRLIHAVLTGRAPSLLDLPDRPPEYEDVGRRCAWQPLYPDALLERSRFECVVINTLAREKLRLDGDAYTPTGMQGWSRVVFRRDSDGERRTMHLEDLLEYLQSWGTSADLSR
jgi:hypothetical protein